jgi:hypothetical protein
MYYYYILLAYYIFGILFFLGCDFIYSRKNKELNNSELLDELLNNDTE